MGQGRRHPQVHSGAQELAEGRQFTAVGVQMHLPEGVTYLSSKFSGDKPALAAPEVDTDAGTVTWPATPLVGNSPNRHFSVRVRVDSNMAAGTELLFRSAFFEIGTSLHCIYYGADRRVCTILQFYS